MLSFFTVLSYVCPTAQFRLPIDLSHSLRTVTPDYIRYSQPSFFLVGFTVFSLFKLSCFHLSLLEYHLILFPVIFFLARRTRKEHESNFFFHPHFLSLSLSLQFFFSILRFKCLSLERLSLTVRKINEERDSGNEKKSRKRKTSTTRVHQMRILHRHSSYHCS